ncbi:hypothetical protein PVAND_017230 [Polypedilum vanderplanki]|uniref:Peptidase S1 domain-containing protein n=1 Tax=Polypedilum vanderplanki TaxID=319348 RepID=A0A9J6BIU3_POLVA|nr:hypothetical protein PVAND_017230 [Polypedilum vanderplanki]
MFQVTVACLTLILLASGANVPDATTNDEFQMWEGRIVGGSQAQLGQFPYQVSLRTIQNSHFCGGFILSNRWIGSAAHCTTPRSTSNTRAVVGTIHRSTGGNIHNLARFVNHPGYQSTTLANDISLIQTVNTITFNNMVQPVGVSSTFINGGVNAVATGWGQTSRTGPTSNVLLWVTLRTLNNNECREKFTKSNAARITDQTICTFTRVGQGTCMGDSGGPLVAGGNVIGAVSWGIPCASGSPDVYVRIASYRSWIMNTIG